MTQGRKKLVVPSTLLNVAIPQDWRARLDLLLWSDFEQRVPKGSYRQFFLERIIEFFEHKTLDLAPYIGSQPGERVVKAHPITIEALKKALEASHGAVT